MSHQLPLFAADQPTPLSRRTALGYLGATAGAATLALAGCIKDTENNPVGANKNDVNLVLSSGDTGLLQYLYALKQLVTIFYTQATVNNSILDTNAREPEALQSINRHCAIHRDLLKVIILRDVTVAPIRLLTTNFTSIDFTQRTTGAGATKLGVLQAAKLFADLSVAACNGIGRLFNTDKDSSGPGLLLLINKMASVNARHAAYIRDRLYPDDATLSFAGDDQVDPVTGLDRASAPADVVVAMQPFLVNQLVLS